TLVDWDDLPRWKLINTALGLNKDEPAETYSTSANLREELDIPPGVTGRLPRANQTRQGLDAEAVEDLGETGGKKSSRSGSGSRSTAPRGRTRTHTDSGQVDKQPAAAKAESGEVADRPRRRRRRTRGGQQAAAGRAATESTG
ncbi:MAG: DEAD/DEAH box helicase, partial [Nakamurella sp.]